MRLTETRNLFDRRLTFPADRDGVIDAVGEVELDAPGGDDETVGAVLSRTDEPEFRSLDELCDTLAANLGDAYVGRKFYDDRGDQPLTDHDQVSF